MPRIILDSYCASCEASYIAIILRMIALHVIYYDNCMVCTMLTVLSIRQ